MISVVRNTRFSCMPNARAISLRRLNSTVQLFFECLFQHRLAIKPVKGLDETLRVTGNFLAESHGKISVPSRRVGKPVNNFACTEMRHTARYHRHTP